MWLFNRRHEIEVTAWNEGDPVETRGGLITRPKEDETSLDILLIKAGNIFIWGQTGRFVVDGLIFQVSLTELEDNSFEIKDGSTHIEYDGNTYRIQESKDYSMYILTQLIQCKAMKVPNVD